jgi:predicted transport protein
MNLIKLYEGIGKLLIVDVSLNRDNDNPQLIFESLNSTGLDLSQADLIRNYILMGLEPKKQEELYKDYWFPMEQSFGHSERSPQFDRFIRDYLTIKNSGKIPIIGEVYADFKNYVRNLKEEDIKDIVADIYLYSKYFVKLTFLKEDDEEIREILSDIKDLIVEVAYPFLLEVYDDYRRQRITREEFLEVLKLVESYVFRRAICGIPPGYLNKTFANLSKSVDKNNYSESLKAAFLLMDSYRRFPTNEEFKQAFVIKDVYNLRIRNYLLDKLENYEQKELINIDKCTIEHILPQNKDLSQEWQLVLGPRWMEIQSKYLHTIGNLTLTAYNPDLGDMSFLEKREDEHGFANSPLRLSRGLRNLEKWDEEEIKRRADYLADQAIKIWSIPEVKSLESYRILKGKKDSGNYTLDDFAESLKGDMGELFRELRMRVMNLDSSVKEEFTKLYIAYKDSTNFVDIIPQKNRLRLILNMPFDEANDPKGSCRDITAIGHHGNGDVETGIGSLAEIDYAMFLIRQSFEWQREDKEI